MYPSPTPAERYADWAVHIIALVMVTAASLALLIVVGAQFGPALITACAIYGVSMVASFGISAAYHILPQHHWRISLRRMDHAAIYALIAGTFTPLLAYAGTISAYIVLTAVWLLTIPAMLYKLLGEHIEPRWSLASYLGLGWIGVFALPDFYAILPTSALVAIVAGGLLYSVGAIIFAMLHTSFRYSIWHSFVLAGTAAFFAAIWISLFG